MFCPNPALYRVSNHPWAHTYIFRAAYFALYNAMPGTLIIGASTIQFRSSRSLHKLGLGRLAQKLNQKRHSARSSQGTHNRTPSVIPSASGSDVGDDDEDGQGGGRRLEDEYGFVIRVQEIVGVRKMRRYTLDGLEITTQDQKVGRGWWPWKSW